MYFCLHRDLARQLILVNIIEHFQETVVFIARKISLYAKNTVSNYRS